MADARLLALLHLCDSLFPTGGYAHSDGLEAATAAGRVASAADVRIWVDAVLDETLAYAEGPAALLAWEAFCEQRWTDLRELDDDLFAQRPSSTAREGTRGVGTRLLKTWQRLYPHPAVEAMIAPPGQPGCWTLPVAFATACASIRIGKRATVEAFLYTRLAAAAASAMRLMPLGQLRGAYDRG